MIVLIVCLFSLNCNSQKFIGQTKSYIISQCQEHEIVINDDNFLVLSYLGHDQFFLFDPANDHLCSTWGKEMSKDVADELLPKLLDGYSHYFSGEIDFIGMVCKTKGKVDRADGTIYTKPGIDLMIYKTDICGNSNKDLVFILFRKHCC